MKDYIVIWVNFWKYKKLIKTPRSYFSRDLYVGMFGGLYIN